MNFSPKFADLEAMLNSSAAVADLSTRPDLVDAFSSLQGLLGTPGNSIGVVLKPGRRTLTGVGDTPVRRHRARKRADRERCIAVLDLETDPFDRDVKAVVFPFLAVLYSDQFEPIVMWEDDKDKLIDRILQEIKTLPEAYTIYAHNGGKFDYMFFISKLRGNVKFKGRGLMRAQIMGANDLCHEIRDSLHVIPQPLAGWKKDKFDYDKNLKQNREKFKAEIIRYCINDCKYLLQILRKFISRNSLKLSIGQAAMSGVREHYKFECLTELADAKIRGVHFDVRDKENYGKPTGKGYFYGGRVECLQGRGIWRGPLYLLDVNSMYPAVMAHFKHPIGASYTFRSGVPDDYTCFVKVACTNMGAFIAKDEVGTTSSLLRHGEFYTTIWEFEAALELGLISDVRIIQCVDCDNFSDFSRFVLPRYDERAGTKGLLDAFHKRDITEKSNDPAYDDILLNNIVIKFELNNAYGKFAQNPRRYTEHCFTDVDGNPDDDLDWGSIPKFQSKEQGYAVWERKAYKWSDELGRYVWDRPPRYYNVGTGASITGCARAILMRALHAVVSPIYCDTDSIICRDPGALEIDPQKLGAWKLEKTFDEVVIAGKKEYAAKVAGLPDGHKDRIIVKAKGVNDVTYAEMIELAGGKEIIKRLKAPTMTRYGEYDYKDRMIRATAPIIQGIENGLSDQFAA